MNSLITDPTLVPQLLPLEPTIRDRLDQLYQEVLPKISGFYSELPCQIIHGDYIRSNLLMQGQQVKGVLDFEFTTPDIRAMDLAAALSWWNPRRLLGTGQEWPPMEKFYRGYISRGNFSDAEIEAIPTLLKLREIAVLTHFTGRYKQGLESINQITDRANLALQMVGWIESVEEKLLNSLQAWR